MRFTGGHLYIGSSMIEGTSKASNLTWYSCSSWAFESLHFIEKWLIWQRLNLYRNWNVVRKATKGRIGQVHNSWNIQLPFYKTKWQNAFWIWQKRTCLQNSWNPSFPHPNRCFPRDALAFFGCFAVVFWSPSKVHQKRGAPFSSGLGLVSLVVCCVFVARGIQKKTDSWEHVCFKHQYVGSIWESQRVGDVVLRVWWNYPRYVFRSQRYGMRAMARRTSIPGGKHQVAETKLNSHTLPLNHKYVMIIIVTIVVL